jgi:hypothetical protein
MVEARSRIRRPKLRKPVANVGPFGTEERALATLVDRLVEAFDPEAVYLFGSRARGAHEQQLINHNEELRWHELRMTHC